MAGRAVSTDGPVYFGALTATRRHVDCMLVDSGPLLGEESLGTLALLLVLKKKDSSSWAQGFASPVYEGREIETFRFSSTTTVRRNASTTTAATTATASRSSSGSAVRLLDRIGETTKEAKIVGV